MCFCRLDIGEGVFRDARHYFNHLAKNVESYRDIAKVFGDSVFYTDDELNDVVKRICKEKHAGQRPSSTSGGGQASGSGRGNAGWLYGYRICRGGSAGQRNRDLCR